MDSGALSDPLCYRRRTSDKGCNAHEEKKNWTCSYIGESAGRLQMIGYIKEEKLIACFDILAMQEVQSDWSVLYRVDLKQKDLYLDSRKMNMGYSGDRLTPDVTSREPLTPSAPAKSSSPARATACSSAAGRTFRPPASHFATSATQQRRSSPN